MRERIANLLFNGYIVDDLLIAAGPGPSSPNGNIYKSIHFNLNIY